MKVVLWVTSGLDSKVQCCLNYCVLYKQTPLADTTATECSLHTVRFQRVVAILRHRSSIADILCPAKAEQTDSLPAQSTVLTGPVM